MSNDSELTATGTHPNNISPVPPSGQQQPQQERERAVFPGNLECSLSLGDPPFRGVYFLIPDTDGRTSYAVFEYSALYRHIATPGLNAAARNVRHPISGATISRLNAMTFVADIPPDIQEFITEERKYRGLPDEDPHEIEEVDKNKYREMLRQVSNR